MFLLQILEISVVLMDSQRLVSLVKEMIVAIQNAVILIHVLIVHGMVVLIVVNAVIVNIRAITVTHVTVTNAVEMKILVMIAMIAVMNA